MSLEAQAAGIIGAGLIDAAGGSIVLFGIIALIGISIMLKKLEIGLSVGAMIAVFLIGFLAQGADSRNLLNIPIGGDFPFFKILFFVLIMGGMLYWAIFLRRR